MARVTGIGGVFVRSQDPKSLASWYARHLGIRLNEYGSASLLWTDEHPIGSGRTEWATFPSDTAYFGAGNRQGVQQAMINYRVDDLDGLLIQLAAANIPVDPHREDSDYGRFAWITDPEGNRIELWQPLVVGK